MTNTFTATQSMVITPVGSDLTSASSLGTTVTTSSSLPTSVGTSAPPSVQLGKDDGLSTKLALKQRFVKTRPLYANSFGGKVFERPTRSNSGLKIIGWRVTNIVQQIWELLEPSLVSLIQAKRQDLELKRPSGAIENPGYALRCFLMGPDKDHATPYVAILCATSWLCKGLGKLIMDSRLLAADGFECCGLPDKPELYGRKDSKAIDKFPSGGNFPHTNSQTIRINWDRDSAGGFLYSRELVATTPATMSTAPPRSPPHQPILSDTKSPVIATLDGFQMHYTSSRGILNGREVQVLYNGSPIGRATVGGIVAVGGELFEMTVRHIFSQPRSFGQFLSDEESTIGGNELEIDMFDSDYEGLEYSGGEGTDDDYVEQSGDEDAEMISFGSGDDDLEQSGIEGAEGVVCMDSDGDDLEQDGGEGAELAAPHKVPERFEFAVSLSPSFGDSDDNVDKGIKSNFKPGTSLQSSHYSLAPPAAVAPSLGQEVTVSNPRGATSFYDLIIPDDPDIEGRHPQVPPKIQPNTSANDSNDEGDKGDDEGDSDDGEGDSDDDGRSVVEYSGIHGTPGASDPDIKFDSPKISTKKPILAALGQNLDWALRNVRMDLPPDPENDPARVNVYFTALVPMGSQRAVVLKTPFDLKPGILESSGVIGVPFESSPQPVQVVSMSSDQIRPGECGSWAMKRVDGTFVGMLIGSCPTLGEAYILRMSDILDDIHNQTGLPAEVAPTYQAPPGYLEKYSNYKRDKQLETQLKSALQSHTSGSKDPIDHVKFKAPLVAPESKIAAESKRRLEAEYDSENEIINVQNKKKFKRGCWINASKRSFNSIYSTSRH